MTTPRPTADLVTSLPSVPDAPELPSWLPDEATLNRLAGEFFAALPGSLPIDAGVAGPLPAASAPGVSGGGVDEAPRVDVPASASDVPRAPGSGGGLAPGGVGPAAAGDPTGVPTAEVPGLAVTDPVAAAGVAPSRSFPDATEGSLSEFGAFGVPGPPLPESFPPGLPLPGVVGLQLAPPGELTPPLHGLLAPLPGAGVPGVPASDQAVTGGGLPIPSMPDAGAAAPFSTLGGISTPGMPPVPTIPGVTGASGGPGNGVSAPTMPDGPGGVPGVPSGLPSGNSSVADVPAVDSFGVPSDLGPPLPSAGAPGLPASDQAFPGSAPVPSVPDTNALPFSTVGGIGTPEIPPVPMVPGVTGAAGTPGSGASGPAVPDGLRGVPAVPSGIPSGSASGADLPSADSFGPPSVPQPPMAVPDAPAPVPTPSTPYYFIAETSPYRRADGGLDSLVSQALGPLLVQPPELDPSTGAAGGRTGSPDPVPGPLTEQFYFTDRIPSAQVPAGGGHSAGAPAGLDRHPPFDVQLIRRDFPILAERINGKPLVWLDNAATTQKPQAVLDRLAHFYQHENSNIHRAAHELAARATDAYEGARKTVARFIGAGSEKDIIFVRGATEAINLVAKSWGKANVHRGDEIIVSHLEHHANIVPWQQLIAETGAKLRVIPVDDTGQLIMSEYSRLLSEKTKIVAVGHVSNALGTVTPVEQVVEMGHRAGACVLIDGAQSVPHLRVNMQTLGADFFVFSGHKIFGPTGIGVVYGRPEVLEKMPPWEGGGNMIADVTFEKTVYQKPPGRFEAGTGNIADAVGLGAALDYVSRLGLETIAAYEHSLLEYATPRMKAVPGLHMIGNATNKASVLSFVLDGYRTEEVGTALNQEGIAVRSGHHCAQPILRRFGLETTVRPSLAFYNTYDEIDLLVAVLHRLAANRGAR